MFELIEVAFEMLRNVVKSFGLKSFVICNASQQKIDIMKSINNYGVHCMKTINNIRLNLVTKRCLSTD